MAPAPLRFGEVDRFDDMEFEPLDIEFVVYRADRQPEVLTLRFRGMRRFDEWTSWLSDVRANDQTINVDIARKLIEAHLIDDDELTAWLAAVEDPDTYVDPQAVCAMSEALYQHYSQRPTLRPSGSSGGGASTSERSEPEASVNGGDRSRPAPRTRRSTS